MIAAVGIVVSVVADLLATSLFCDVCCFASLVYARSSLLNQLGEGSDLIVVSTVTEIGDLHPVKMLVLAHTSHRNRFVQEPSFHTDKAISCLRELSDAR